MIRSTPVMVATRSLVAGDADAGRISVVRRAVAVNAGMSQARKQAVEASASIAIASSAACISPTASSAAAARIA